MRVERLRLIGESWQDAPHHLPQDSFVLAIDETWKVLLGRLPRMTVYLPSGWYTILWDEEAGLYDLIDIKHKIEAEHGTGDSYVHRRRRRSLADVRRNHGRPNPRSRGSSGR